MGEAGRGREAAGLCLVLAAAATRLVCGRRFASSPAARATAALSKLMRDETVSAEATQRLLAIYIISQNGIKAADRMRLIREARPPFTVAMQNAIINLVHLGIAMQKGSRRSGVAGAGKGQSARADYTSISKRCGTAE